MSECSNVINEGFTNPSGPAQYSSQIVFNGSTPSCLPSVNQGATLNQVLAALMSYVCQIPGPLTEISSDFVIVGDGNLTEYLEYLEQLIRDIENSIPSSIPRNLCDLTVGECISLPPCFDDFSITGNSPVEVLIESMASLICDTISTVQQQQDLWVDVFNEISTGNQEVVFNQPAISTSGLSALIGSGFAMLDGQPFKIPHSVSPIVLVANRDNYIQVDANGQYSVVLQPIGGPAPSLPYVGLYRVTTDGSSAVSTVYIGDPFLFDDMDRFADDVIETRHILDANVVNSKLDEIIAPSSVGESAFMFLTYNSKGRIVSATSNITIEDLEESQVLLWNGLTWKNANYNPNKLPEYTTAEAAALGFDLSNKGTLIYNTTDSKVQVWNGAAFESIH